MDQELRRISGWLIDDTQVLVETVFANTAGPCATEVRRAVVELAAPYTRYPREGEAHADDDNFFQQLWFHELGTETSDDRYEIGRDFPRTATDSSSCIRPADRASFVCSISVVVALKIRRRRPLSPRFARSYRSPADHSFSGSSRLSVQPLGCTSTG